MRHDASKVVQEYAWAMFRRGQEPMEPLNFVTNWHDQPSRHKTYPTAPRLPLPVSTPRLPTMRELFTETSTASASGWSLDRLATLLRLSYGILDRRLDVHCNRDIAARVQFPHAVWGRATASGGGMSPAEIYLVSGARGALLPGVYHYATGHHALERLLAGDVTPVVRAAAGSAVAEADDFLLVTIRFWKNAFKYNSFCYHVVTHDVGALLGSWELLGRALGVPMRRLFRFDTAPLDALLGLDSDAESVFAVVPLPAGHDRPSATGDNRRPVAAGPANVRHEAFERSRQVLVFDRVTAVHRAGRTTISAPPHRLADPAPRQPPGDPVQLPPVELDRLEQPLDEVLARRRTGFGRFRRPPDLTAGQLGTTLAVAAGARRYQADVKQPDGGPPWTRLWVFVNRVEGQAPGTYAYCDRRHTLLPVGNAPDEGMSAFLQQQYFLSNYSMSQVGAVVAISGRIGAMLDVFGPGGYRLLNSEVGAVSQAAHCAATAQRIGCGAALGFDNVAMNAALGIGDGDEHSVLFLLLGREPEITAEVAYRL